MLDRETKYTKELAKCRENIKKTKKLIDYHKNMLKTFESKESELMAKLERTLRPCRRSGPDQMPGQALLPQ